MDIVLVIDFFMSPDGNSPLVEYLGLYAKQASKVFG
jgi:hypothetical protein